MLYRLLDCEPHEAPAIAWSFAYFFLLLCSYYLLRPVRDSLAVEAGTAALQWLFSATFVAMLALVPVFGWLCQRLPRERLLPLVYAFFALNLGAFTLALDGRVFFVWLSVFNLFVVSVFWSYMSDVFDAAQAARLYGPIAAGGSGGAIAGPILAALLVRPLGTRGLLLVAALLLAATILCIARIGRWSKAHPRRGEPPAELPIGGGVLEGARAALTSPFLLAVCGYLLCYTALSTALYFQQVEIVRDAVPDATERTQLFASVDLAVNVLTLLVQLLAFARLSALLRTTGMLVLMPLVSLAGFVWLGASPTLAALIAFGITRRVGEFAVSKPAREALFTIVPRAARYKAKNFIDTVIYRGGDTLSGWAFGKMAALAVAAAGLSLAWTALALYLGHKMKAWTHADAASSPASQPERS